MVNKEFLKTLVILYIEDDNDIRNKLGEFLSSFFKKVIMAVDGEEGLKKFNEHEQNIDLIISDITMPNMDGIEMLCEIRKVNKEVPFIFTTAYTDSHYLLSAIEQGVSYYAAKPVDIKKLISNIEQICTIKYQEKAISNKKQELERYLSIIDKAALISKIDLNGNITLVNDMFCEVSGYTQEELIGKNQNIIRHPDMPISVYDDMLKVIKDKKVWKGKLKAISKNGDTYYVNSTIFPILDDFSGEIKEFIDIRFITTEYVAKEREFKKKVLNNIKMTKQNEQALRDRIKELEKFAGKVKHINMIEERIEQKAVENINLTKQLKHYENMIKQLNASYDEMVTKTNKKVSVIATEHSEIQKENSYLKEELKKTVLELNTVKSEFKKLNERVFEQAKKIENLYDVIKFNESEIRKLKEGN